MKSRKFKCINCGKVHKYIFKKSHSKACCDNPCILSKHRFPRFRTRIFYKIFNKGFPFPMSWKWYHSVFSEKLLKIFNKHYVPWTVIIEVNENE